MTFTRKCPSCGKDVIHTDKKAYTDSVKMKTDCSFCARQKLDKNRTELREKVKVLRKIAPLQKNHRMFHSKNHCINCGEKYCSCVSISVK
jgi:hypothetical protein